MLKPTTPFEVTGCLLSCLTDRSRVTVQRSDFPKTVSQARGRPEDWPAPGGFLTTRSSWLFLHP